MRLPRRSEGEPMQRPSGICHEQLAGVRDEGGTAWASSAGKGLRAARAIWTHAQEHVGRQVSAD